MSFLKFLIGWPLTIAAFFFIVKLIAPQAPALIASANQINISLFIHGILSFIIFYFLRSYVWHRLIRGLDYHIPFKKSAYLWAASELKRYIPGNIWSFLTRTVIFAQQGVKKKDIAKSLIIEGELFVLGSLIISILSLPFILDISFASPLGIFAIVLLALVIKVYIFNQRLLKFLPPKISATVGFICPSYKPLENASQVALSATALFFFGLGNYFVIGSLLPLHPQLVWQLTGFFVLAFLAGYLSIITPAGFGVREGIVIYGLSKIASLSAAGFAALFSRLVLIISELIFVALVWIWYETGRSIVLGKTKITKVEKWIASNKHEAFVIFLMTVYTIYFTTTSFLRYDNFYTGRFDLGNMVQTVWNTVHGNIFTLTNPNATETVSRLAFHGDFILILLAPFYTLWPDPKILLLIQTVVLTLGAFFVYLISLHILKNKNISVTFAFAYLINPSLQLTNLYDFHAVTLATTFLLATYYFYLKKKYRHFVIFAVLAALCKEHLWLIIALFGGLVIIRQKKFLLGTIVASLSIAMFYFLIWHGIPGALGSQHFALSYYSDFGESPTSVVKSIILSPHKIFALIFEPSRFNYLTQLFSPLGYLSLLAPLFLIFAGPDFLVNLLSNNAQLHQIYYQYTATITPFLFIAAINGVGVMMHMAYGIWHIEKTKNHLLYAISYILVTCLIAAYQFGPMPGSHNPNITMLTEPLPNREYIDSFLSHIPEDFSVAASNNIGSHLSERQNIYVVPQGIDKADIVLLLLTDQWTFKTDTELVEKLKRDPRYVLIAEQNVFVAFLRKR